MVLNLEGAMAVRTVHRPSEDPKWDTSFINRVNGALKDFKVNSGDDINDGGPPDPRVEVPPRINVI